MLGRKQPLLHQTLQDRPDRWTVDQLQDEQVGLWGRREERDWSAGLIRTLSSGCGLAATYAAAGCDGDLHCVTSRLTHLFQVQRLVGGLVVTSLYGQWSRIDAHLKE